MAQQVENLYKEVLEKVIQLDPFQAKKLKKPVSAPFPNLESNANRYLVALVDCLKAQGLGLQDAIVAYVNLCSEIRQETLLFARQQNYSRADQETVKEELYSNPKKMFNCLLGLGLSQFLWPNHYALYSFYVEFLRDNQSEFKQCLEIGPGHGAYLAASLESLPKAHHWAYDLSPTAVAFCKGILFYSSRGTSKNVQWFSKDPIDSPSQRPFDLITLGEVIEHLDDPIRFLKKLKPLLSPAGKLFLTTCANCPSRDHVYLFKNVSDIRRLLKQSGYTIQKECILEQSPDPQLAARNTVNYGAVLQAI